MPRSASEGATVACISGAPAGAAGAAAVEATEADAATAGLARANVAGGAARRIGEAVAEGAFEEAMAGSVASPRGPSGAAAASARGAMADASREAANAEDARGLLGASSPAGATAYLGAEDGAGGLEEDPDCGAGVVGLQQFDRGDVAARCRELLRRVALATVPPAPLLWRWDILEFLEDSRGALQDIRQAHASASRGAWREIGEATGSEHDATTLPVGLRRQCEDLLGRRETWVGDFEAELVAMVTRGRELRERLLFEDADRDQAGWFTSGGVSPLEVQRLLERHLDMHQRGARLARQLQTVRRALAQQGAVSSRRRAFAERTVGEKLQSSILTLAAVAVAPVPGSSEMWLATTATMWLSGDQAWQHVVYEHPRDSETEAILDQFQCRSAKARAALSTWSLMPPAKRKGCMLVHNASVRRVFLKTHLVNCIDGHGDAPVDWTAALEDHPLGALMRQAMGLGVSADQDKVPIGAQRLAVVPLPPKPDTNWSWRGTFSYGDTKVGECALREGGVFSFICVDCGLRVGDREEEGAVSSSTSALAEPIAAAPAASTATGGDALEGPPTTVQVVNHMEETVQVKIFYASTGGNAVSSLLRRPLEEGAVSPGAARDFSLQVKAEGGETYFEVEIRVGLRKAKCEVVGEQVVFVDGLLAEL